EPKLKREHGLHVIARSQEVLPNYPRLVLVANPDSLARKRAAAIAFLAGEMQGISYALAHPRSEISLAAQILHKPNTDPGLAFLYKVIVQTHAASPTAEIPLSKLSWLV